jgi:hypothetical protein
VSGVCAIKEFLVYVVLFKKSTVCVRDFEAPPRFSSV